MTVRILIGDVRDRAVEVPDGSIDCILTDPPYGETSLQWDRRVAGWPELLLPKLKPSGSMWLFGSLRLIMQMVRDGEFAGWSMSQDIIWEKHNGTGLFNDRFRRVHEIAVHFYPAASAWKEIYKRPQFTNDARARVVRKKGRPAQWIGATGETVYRSEDGGPRLMRSVLQVRSEHGRAKHPTQKPLGIVEPLLLYACPPGGHVLDPFAGSGTTGLLARRHGMTCTLIEGRPDYAELIQKRLDEDAPLLSREEMASCA